MSSYISYETDRIRLVLLALNFYAKRLTAREGQIEYIHEPTNGKIYVPKCKRLSKLDAEQILDRITNIVGKYELLKAIHKIDKKTKYNKK